MASEAVEKALRALHKAGIIIGQEKGECGIVWNEARYILETLEAEVEDNTKKRIAIEMVGYHDSR